jgi:hypothetical protein
MTVFSAGTSEAFQEQKMEAAGYHADNLSSSVFQSSFFSYILAL